MYIRGLIPRIFAELADADPIVEGKGPDNFFLNHQRISQRAIRTSHVKSLDQEDRIASRGGPYLYSYGNL